MPFMVGKAPMRRTLKYLEAGRLYLKDKIQIFSLNYDTRAEHHKGTRDFMFWYMPQLQYKNPKVQVISFRNLTPSPFIKCYYEDGKTMLIDTDSRTKDEILEHLLVVVGKSKEELNQQFANIQKLDNPANFGVGCRVSCMCTIIGQIPCPSVVPLPFHMRGKHIRNKKGT